MQREYELGQMLRLKYDKFLGETEFDDFHARSTNFDRTKMSLQLVLAGVHKPNNRSRLSSQVNWSPVPINFVDREVDFLRTFDCKK